MVGVGATGALGDIEVATHLAKDLLCFESSTYANLSCFMTKLSNGLQIRYASCLLSRGEVVAQLVTETCY